MNVNTEPSKDTALAPNTSCVARSYSATLRSVPRTRSSSSRLHATSLNRSIVFGAMPNTVSVTVLIGAVAPCASLKRMHRCASSSRKLVMPAHANTPLSSVACSLTACRQSVPVDQKAWSPSAKPVFSPVIASEKLSPITVLMCCGRMFL